MSDYPDNNYYHQNHSDNTRNFNSNLRATASEYHPSRNTGAVRKNFGQNLQRSDTDSHLHANAQEFVPGSSNGAVRKKYYNKREKSRYGGNWRSNENFNDNASFHERPRYDNRRNYYRQDYEEDNHSMTHRHKPNQYYDRRKNRSYRENPQPRKNDYNHKHYPKPTDTAGHRERLTEMIDSNMLECMVCCEKIRRTDKIWSCNQCYNIIHLNCITAWAKSSKTDENWRCPACQNTYNEVPQKSTCYCGKVTDPKVNPNIISHGCDNMCLRKGKNCEHRCSILCHPGPCPECTVMVAKACGCGKTRQTVKCCSDVKIVCDGQCDKLLNCSVHRCMEKCHADGCPDCLEQIQQQCHCGKTSRKVPCNKDNAGQTSFDCDNICDRVLSCQNHRCTQKCHPGPCSVCDSDPTVIKTCHCGQTPLATDRESCLDPVPTCDKLCNKTLICGPPNRPHQCKEKCHKGKCPSCPLTTVLKCRCGHMDKEVACQKLTTKADDARCEKKCTKKRLCGKHTCKQKCCIEIEHMCPLPCNKLLTCGQHKCQLTCHSGRCPTCMETSFDELYCECGASVMYPPVPCGTKPPLCSKPCGKSRPCGHPPNHDCHPGPCPPCFVLIKQWCFGQHEQRGAIPCNQNSFSCGLACGKPMPCGRHKCHKPCHEDVCPVPCAQPCAIQRQCGHGCGKPCHEPPCPDSQCRQLVPVTCQCGLQKSQKVCVDLIEEYRNFELSQLKDKMSLSQSQSVDISDMTFKKPQVFKILDCNDECKVMERNRRLAIGLQIQNPDLSQKLTPRYGDFLKQWGKKDPKFCQRIHDKLTELVQLAKQSKQKSRAHSFESMNRDKRQFIHEYCEHFGVESEAYDAEPNRNVVATAIKDKSWLPSMSLMEILQRENGQRKVPGPVLGYKSASEPQTVLKLLNKRVE